MRLIVETSRLPGGVVIHDEVVTAARTLIGAGRAPPPARLAYAAAHVVMKPAYAGAGHSLANPGSPHEIEEHIDWESTGGIRRHLASEGFAIAEAMDTAQRFLLGWPLARRLIEECGRLGLPHGFVAGAGADGLPDEAPDALLVETVITQAHAIRSAGGEVILLPLVPLARRRATESGFVDVYRAIIEALPGPLYLHWLGAMFHPALDHYFPGRSFERIMELDPGKIRGAKLSLLDAGLEVRLRRALLQRDQILLTGDDWSFASLIAGGEGDARSEEIAPIERHTKIGAREVPLGDFSHALLGVFDGLARPAGLALRALAQGRAGIYSRLMRAGEALGRHLFEPPTQRYKAGLAFLSWLNGRQESFALVNHEERARPVAHFLRAAALASDAGAIDDPASASARLESWLRSDLSGFAP